jgi:Trm5-related predicted tRNA methylase
MPTSTDPHPLTNDQEVQLRTDLALVEDRLQDIAILMRVCYGEKSQAVARADETSAALQRLKWELERTKLLTQAAGSA